MPMLSYHISYIILYFKFHYVNNVIYSATFHILHDPLVFFIVNK